MNKHQQENNTLFLLLAFSYKLLVPLKRTLNPFLIRGGRRNDAASGRTTTIPFTNVLLVSTGVSGELTPTGYGTQFTVNTATVGRGKPRKNESKGTPFRAENVDA